MARERREIWAIDSDMKIAIELFKYDETKLDDGTVSALMLDDRDNLIDETPIDFSYEEAAWEALLGKALTSKLKSGLSYTLRITAIDTDSKQTVVDVKRVAERAAATLIELPEIDEEP